MHRSTPTEPLVSVAMITYNHLPYLEKAVEGVLSQRTNFPVQLVIGEDCSPDGTRELAFKLAQKYPEQILLITSEKNVGAHKNFTRVERACVGKYMAFCEGDDYWHDPTKLQKQVDFLEARPTYSMVHSHCHRYIVATQQLLTNNLTVPTGLDDANAYEDLLMGRRNPLTVTVLARRDAVHYLLDNCPECTDPKWPMGDTQRWLELSRLGSVGCIHEPLATTNVLTESAGQSANPQKRLKFYLAARELHLHYLKKYPVDAELDRRVRERLSLILLQHAYVAQDPVVAQKMYDAFIEANGASQSRAACLLWGSRSKTRAKLVRPLIKMEELWRRGTRRFQRTVSKPALSKPAEPAKPQRNLDEVTR
jgi:glycosyltransferase involved in cell wall biosynthesis